MHSRVVCRAAVVPQYGKVELATHYALPRLRSHEIAVRVRAASVNPLDAAMARGYGRALFEAAREGAPLPFALGRDCSGVVESVGGDVWDRVRGEEVVGCSSPPFGGGTWSEVVHLPASMVVSKPPALSHEQAACVPYAGLTAWSALFSFGRAQPGQRVLVLGGAGAVGSLVLQLAKAHGCELAATCSARHIELCRSLGAAEVADHGLGDEHVREAVRKCDLVIDAARFSTPEAQTRLEELALSLLRPGGRFVTLSGDLVRSVDREGVAAGLVAGVAELLRRKRDRFLHRGFGYEWALFAPRPDALRRLVEMAGAGLLRQRVHGQVFSLDRAAEALRVAESGAAEGKVVISPSLLDSSPPAPAPAP
jgi:NADPH:quinone reductase-like Zn-dependent oxidoreductase